jgi:A/G-specific adenine glycosylase
MQVESKAPLSSPIARDLLAYYDGHARTLPWRSPPNTPPPDPYRVWLSEVMLQQTTVAAVIPYFERFAARWPDFAALAAAPDVDVMAAWAGLGYYSRARNLIACARAVVAGHGGTLPPTAAALRTLPGIGDYTAAAIASIAFGEAAPVVDANVERVTARLFAIKTPLPAAKADIRARVAEITPTDRPGDFAQAMMDLGAGVCSVKRPQCLLCPINPHCAARAAGIAETLPIKPPKKAKPERTGTAYWMERDDAFWLITRPAKGMLGGMAALPDDGWSARQNGHAAPPFAALWVDAGLVQHGFTHFTLYLTVKVAILPADAPDPPFEWGGEGRWVKLADWDTSGLPTLFAKAAQRAVARGD